MARVTPSAVIADISGKIRGSVFQKNQTGLILRNQSAPINRRSVSQQVLKTANQLCQSIWNQLSVSDLQAWKSYALFRNVSHKKNPALTISGQQLFLKENQVRYAMTKQMPDILPTIVSSPVIGNPEDIIQVIDVKNTAGVLTAEFDRSINPGILFLILQMSRPLTNSQESQYNKIAIIPMGDPTGNPNDITTAYQSIYSRIPNTGEWVNFTIAVGRKTSNGISGTTRGRLQVS